MNPVRACGGNVQNGDTVIELPITNATSAKAMKRKVNNLQKR